MNRQLLWAGLLGATAVATGAYAAHGLEELIASLGYEADEVARRVDIFATGSRYQLHAAAALLAIALVGNDRRKLGWAYRALLLGALLFCGLLYVLAFAGSGWRGLGAIVPLGGAAMIAAWCLVAWEGITSSRQPQSPVLPDEEIVRIEELLTHQQRMLQELSEVVREIRQQTDTRQERLETIEQTVRRLIELQQGADASSDEPPPHY